MVTVHPRWSPASNWIELISDSSHVLDFLVTIFEYIIFDHNLPQAISLIVFFKTMLSIEMVETSSRADYNDEVV